MTIPRILAKMTNKLNSVGVSITAVVGTMWVAVSFACLALVSLPGAISTGDPVIIVAWVAQTFLQLILLPIIMVGQTAQGAKTEKRDQETHDVVMAAHLETLELLKEVKELHDRK
jgi:uncharacterized membrane protein